MDIKQLDTEADLRQSIMEAHACLGGLLRRVPGMGFPEISITDDGGPCLLLISSGIDARSRWQKAVATGASLAPGGWTWVLREDGEGSWLEANRGFGEGSRSMGISIMLWSEATDEDQDAAIGWISEHHSQIPEWDRACHLDEGCGDDPCVCTERLPEAF